MNNAINLKKKIFRPTMHYWGFFVNSFQIPDFGNISFSFRLKKKESSILILSFLFFFFKSFFLYENLTYKIEKKTTYINFNIKIKRINQNNYYFLLLFKYFNYFMYKEVYNFKNYLIKNINKDNNGSYLLINSKNFPLFVYNFLQNTKLFKYDYLYTNNYIWILYSNFVEIFFSNNRLNIYSSFKFKYILSKRFKDIIKKVNFFIFFK